MRYFSCCMGLPRLRSPRFGLPLGLGLVQNRCWNVPLSKEATDRHLLPPPRQFPILGLIGRLWGSIARNSGLVRGVYVGSILGAKTEGVYVRSWRNSKERCSFRESQLEGVSD